MKKPQKLSGILLILIFPIGLSGCAGSFVSSASVSSPETATEMAEAVISGAVSASIFSGTRAQIPRLPQSQTPSFARLLSLPMAFADTTCEDLNTGSDCEGGAVTFNYRGCNFTSSTATWNGSENMEWVTGTCPQLAAGATIHRSFASGTTRTITTGVVVAISTTDVSGWKTPVTAAPQVLARSSSLTQSIQIPGIRLVGSKATTDSKGNPTTANVWDYTIHTPTPLILSSNVIPSGLITVQHNITQYVASASIVSPLVYGTTCCHPIGGEIDSVLTGTKSGTEKLLYSSTCGQATLTTADPGSVPVIITLQHCI